MSDKKRSIQTATLNASENRGLTPYEKSNTILNDMQPDTQNFMLLKYLKEHGSITPIDAWFDLGIYRTSARIHDLREKGVNIRTVIIEKTTPEGDTKRYAKYIYEGEV